jgi:hypothetical protein
VCFFEDFTGPRLRRAAGFLIEGEYEKRPVPMYIGIGIVESAKRDALKPSFNAGESSFIGLSSIMAQAVGKLWSRCTSGSFGEYRPNHTSIPQTRPVPNRGNAEGSLAAITLGNPYTKEGQRTVGLVTQFLLQLCQPCLRALGFDLIKRHPVHGRDSYPKIQCAFQGTHNKSDSRQISL